MKRYAWITVALLLTAVFVSLVVLVVRNQKEDRHTVTPEVQGKEVVKADSISQTNEEEVGIETEGNEVTAKKNILEDSVKTNAIRRYKDDNVINSYVVGRWQNIDNKGWYCVFYGEVDEEGMCWGKEWDESENVMEEDLPFHKNGWFKWRIKDGVLHEFAVMNMSDVIIYKSYKVIDMKNNMLVMQEELHGSYKYSFVRVDE